MFHKCHTVGKLWLITDWCEADGEFYFIFVFMLLLLSGEFPMGDFFTMVTRETQF